MWAVFLFLSVENCTRKQKWLMLIYGYDYDPLIWVSFFLCVHYIFIYPVQIRWGLKPKSDIDESIVLNVASHELYDIWNIYSVFIICMFLNTCMYYEKKIQFKHLSISVEHVVVQIIVQEKKKVLLSHIHVYSPWARQCVTYLLLNQSSKMYILQ